MRLRVLPPILAILPSLSAALGQTVPTFVGELPIVGVNTFLLPPTEASRVARVPVVRSSEDEKREQIRNLRAFQARNEDRAGPALRKLRETALRGGNLFDELMNCVAYASLGQITGTLFDVGGQYRRSL